MYMYLCTVDDDSSLNEEVVGILEAVKDVCAIDDDETQPHACNQGIVFSTGQCVCVFISSHSPIHY